MKVYNEDVIQVIREAETLADLDSIDVTSSLSEVGCDSLDIMNVMLKIQEKFDVFISDTDIDDLQTVEDIVGFLNSNQKR